MRSGPGQVERDGDGDRLERHAPLGGEVEPGPDPGEAACPELALELGEDRLQPGAFDGQAQVADRAWTRDWTRETATGSAAMAGNIPATFRRCRAAGLPRLTACRREPRPAAVKGLSLVSLFNDFASEMVYPLLPAFVTGTLGGGAALLGLLDGAADLTSAVLKVVSGRLADRPRWRGPLILVGYATAVLVRPLIAVAGAAWQVVGFRVIDRVGKGIRTPPRDALIAGITPPRAPGPGVRIPSRRPTTSARSSGSLAAWYLLSRGVDVRQRDRLERRAGRGGLCGAGGGARGARADVATGGSVRAPRPTDGPRRPGRSGRPCSR